MFVSSKHNSAIEEHNQLGFALIGAELEVSTTGNQIETGNKQNTELIRQMSVSSTRNSSPTVQSKHRTVILDPKPLSHMAQSLGGVHPHPTTHPVFLTLQALHQTQELPLSTNREPCGNMSNHPDTPSKGPLNSRIDNM